MLPPLMPPHTAVTVSYLPPFPLASCPQSDRCFEGRMEHALPALDLGRLREMESELAQVLHRDVVLLSSLANKKYNKQLAKRLGRRMENSSRFSLQFSFGFILNEIAAMNGYTVQQLDFDQAERML
eukprot:scaffold248471_cov36-Tisochrysis_lutea.AAC.2